MNNEYFISSRISGDKHEFIEIGELLQWNFSHFNFLRAFTYNPHAANATSTRETLATEPAVYKFLNFVLFGFSFMGFVGRKAGLGGGESGIMKSMTGSSVNDSMVLKPLCLDKWFAYKVLND